MARTRLDQLLVDRGLAPSRGSTGHDPGRGGRAGGRGPTLKLGNLVAVDAAVTVRDRPRWASRAGDKLEAALEAFAIDAVLYVARRRPSTGGFTDVLLSRRRAGLRGRCRSGAVDRSAAARPARDLHGANQPADADWPAGADRPRHAGSLVHLAPARPAVVRRLLRTGGAVVALVKPQFEAGKDAVPRGGDPRPGHPWGRAAPVRHGCSGGASACTAWCGPR